VTIATKYIYSNWWSHEKITCNQIALWNQRRWWFDSATDKGFVWCYKPARGAGCGGKLIQIGLMVEVW